MGDATKAHTLVLRIWLEPAASSASSPEWRGTVRNVMNGDQASFRHIEGVADAIRKLIEQAETRSAHNGET